MLRAFSFKFITSIIFNREGILSAKKPVFDEKVICEMSPYKTKIIGIIIKIKIIRTQTRAENFLLSFIDNLSCTGLIKYARTKAEIKAIINGFIIK